MTEDGERVDEVERPIDRYGRPTQLDTATVLRALGLRSEIHPQDARACGYPSMEAARAFARVNVEQNDTPVFGPFDTADGPVMVLDLRRQLRARGNVIMDPLWADDRPRPETRTGGLGDG